MIQVAKIGKSVGVHGGVRLHTLTDFPEIFGEDITYIAKSTGLKPQTLFLKVKSYHDGIAVFEGYESKESVKTLTNFILYTSLEDTRQYCELKEGEIFWFDMVGSEVIEDGEKLGEVIEIERIGEVDYLLIKAVTRGNLPKKFMLPYIDRYILEFKDKKIYTQGAQDIWVAS